MFALARACSVGPGAEEHELAQLEDEDDDTEEGDREERPQQQPTCAWRPAGPGLMELVGCQLPYAGASSQGAAFALPREVHRRLHGYQRAGVAWMARICARSQGGVLADEMGLGKTVQVCALLSGLRRAGSNSALVMVPVSLLEQWRREAEAWCPDWPVFTFHGTAAQRARALGGAMRPTGGILLTTYALFSSNSTQLAEAKVTPEDQGDSQSEQRAPKRHWVVDTGLRPQAPAARLGGGRGGRRPWDVVICDEAHHLRNMSTLLGKSVRNIRSGSRILLTGTPIQNALQDLWALMDFAQPGLLGNHATFAKHFNDPINHGSVRNATPFAVGLKRHLSEQLWQLVRPHFLRRTKLRVGLLAGEGAGGEDGDGGDAGGLPAGEAQVDARADAEGDAGVAGEFQALPPKLETVVWLLPTKEQVSTYRRVLDGSSLVREAAVKARMGIEVFRAIGLLKRLCNHPALLLPASRRKVWAGLLAAVVGDDLSAGERPASAEEEEKEADMVGDEADYQPSFPRDTETLLALSAKLRCLAALLPQLAARGHCTLVFSQGARMLDLIEACVLRRNGLGYLRMDGATSATARAERVKEFQAQGGKYPCMLLTTGVGGVGLNLTAADRVVLVDPAWNPAIDAQAVDRVFRLGQRRAVCVYRLVASGLMEDRIFRLQVFKTGLMRGALEARDQHQYFTAREIRGLFDWTDPSSGETRTLLAQKHSPEDVERIVRGAREDGGEEQEGGWLQAGPVIGLSNFSALFGPQAAPAPEPVDENTAQATDMKVRLMVAEERERQAVEQRREREQSRGSADVSLDEASLRVAASAAASKAAAQTLRERRANLAKVQRLEQKTAQGLQHATAAVAQASSRQPQAEQLEQSAGAQTDSWRGEAVELAQASAAVEGILTALDDNGRAVEGIVDAAVVGLRVTRRAVEAFRTSQETTEAALVGLARAERRLITRRSRGESEDEAETAWQQARRCVYLARDAASAESVALLKAGLAFARSFKNSVRRKATAGAVRDAQDVAMEAFRRLEGAWRAVGRAQEAWAGSLPSRRVPAGDVAAAAATSSAAAAAQAALVTERERRDAEAEQRSICERRQTCEAAVAAAEAAHAEAERAEADWRRRREQLRVALGVAHLDVLRSSAQQADAQASKRALQAWCASAEDEGLRMQNATANAMEVLRNEAYDARQVEEAYDAKRRRLVPGRSGLATPRT